MNPKMVSFEPEYNVTNQLEESNIIAEKNFAKFIGEGRGLIKQSSF